jgi:membrane fusion protein, heavy metal efflux system
MDFKCPRILARIGRRFAQAIVLAVFSAIACTASAHEGHDHGPEPKAGSTVPSSPRLVAISENYQLVGILEGEVLVIYLDRAEDNAPVTTATLEVSLDGTPHKAELLAKSGTYEITAPLLRKPGSYEVLVSVTDGAINDLLVGSLRIPGDNHAGERSLGQMFFWLLLMAGVLVVLLLAWFGSKRMRQSAAVAVTLALLLSLHPNRSSAHEGHDHGPDVSASPGNSPARRPDGTIFLPKPTQRLLEIQTRSAQIETRTKRVRFSGRIVANPNRSGIVQSTLQGRYEAPDGRVPPLGLHVKAGDLLGRIAPSFASIDSSDMAQTLGTLDQEIALSRRKLARQEQLLETNVVAKAAVEDIRIQVEGLEKRRRDLLAARVRPEDLRAPVDGVIATTRVVSGQVVGPSDQLFQIVDPTSLLVEALVFDQIDPDHVDEATASATNGTMIKLKFMGRSRALQQQYSLLQFLIIDAGVSLNVGAPVTVTAANGEPVTGIILPRAALAQAPNGQTVVFSHKEPEIFAPRAVRTESFDSENVLVVSGILAGEKIVIRNAPLLNQVR